MHRLLSVMASLVVENGLYGSQAPVAASPGLQSTGSVVVAHRLSFSVALGIFQFKDRTLVSCFGRRILYH